ncbi:MAG: hypothetical protein JXR88_00150 [Clostridia bacterium]|nr:hypothetical protein [Clostridia bacterium]
MNNKGATSVLIIMMMVVLMVFGLTILTATLSSETLSDKKIDWLEEYYVLEADAAVALSNFDEALQGLKELVVESPKGDMTRSNYYKELINDQYEDFQHVFISVSKDQGDYQKYIDMDITCYIPSDTLSDEAFLTSNNFEINQYLQTQDLFEYKDIEFGVPYAPEQ